MRKSSTAQPLARMSLSELLYHVPTLDGSPVQIASTARMHKAPEVFPISIQRYASGEGAIRFGTLEIIYAERSSAGRAAGNDRATAYYLQQQGWNVR
jgi:hypothetical protein